MAIIDKHQRLDRMATGDGLSIELGCGPTKRKADSIGIDLHDHQGVDLVGDALEVLRRFPDGSVRSAYSAHFLEHLADARPLLQELARVLASDGVVTLIVPHFSNPFYHSDPTHRHPYGLYTMSYLCHDDLLIRRVPHYEAPIPLQLQAVSLHFKSYRPRYLRHAFKRAFEAIVNLCTYTKEFYEENLCWLLPCYEVRYQLGHTRQAAR